MAIGINSGNKGGRAFAFGAPVDGAVGGNREAVQAIGAGDAALLDDDLLAIGAGFDPGGYGKGLRAGDGRGAAQIEPVIRAVKDGGFAKLVLIMKTP